MAPLSQVIAEANRGSAIPIRVADPAVGALKVSGRFRVDNPELTADRLAALFDLKIDRTRHDEILLRSR
jgi:transmembrane sensor